MTIFLVGHMDGDTFVPSKVTEAKESNLPRLHEVYIGGGSAREIVGILSGNHVATIELDGEALTKALKHLWDSGEELEEE